MAEKGTYWVRVSYSGHIEVHGQFDGDIVKTISSELGCVNYADGYSSNKPEAFRKATPDEIKAYDNGVRNIKNLDLAFKEGDILEFISKNPISTCFKIGEHVTFKRYDSENGYLTAKNKEGILQSACIHQFKRVDSLVEEYTLKVGDLVIGNKDACCYTETTTGAICEITELKNDEYFYLKVVGKSESYIVKREKFDPYTKKEEIKSLSIFKSGDIVRCIVDNPSNLIGLCKKGDLLKVNNSYSLEYFSSSECNGISNCWSGLHSDEFELTELTLTLSISKSKFEIGDIVIGNSEANTYGFTKEGWKGIISSFKSDGLHFILKSIIGSSSYIVRMDCFDFYSKPEVIAPITKIPNTWKLAKPILIKSETKMPLYFDVERI